MQSHHDSKQEVNLSKQEIVETPLINRENVMEKDIILLNPGDPRERGRSKDRIVFSGKYRANYHEFIKFVIDTNTSKIDMTNIGHVSEDKKYYFEKTDKVKNVAERFLKFFCRHNDNINAMIANHENRDNSESASPTSATFTLVTIDGEEQCLFSISSLEQTNEDLKNKLIRSITAYNKFEDHIPIIFIGGYISNYMNVIQAFKSENETDTRNKTCAESYTAYFLIKLFSQHDAVEVLGGLSISLYPYTKDKWYKHKPKGHEGIFELPNNLQIFLKPVCQSCLGNKAYHIELWKAAILFHQVNHTSSSKHQRMATSPERESRLTWIKKERYDDDISCDDDYARNPVTKPPKTKQEASTISTKLDTDTAKPAETSSMGLETKEKPSSQMVDNSKPKAKKKKSKKAKKTEKVVGNHEDQLSTSSQEVTNAVDGLVASQKESEISVVADIQSEIAAQNELPSTKEVVTDTVIEDNSVTLFRSKSAKKKNRYQPNPKPTSVEVTEKEDQPVAKDKPKVKITPSCLGQVGLFAIGAFAVFTGLTVYAENSFKK